MLLGNGFLLAFHLDSLNLKSHMWPEATEVGGTVLTCHLGENARNTKILLAVEG